MLQELDGNTLFLRDRLAADMLTRLVAGETNQGQQGVFAPSGQFHAASTCPIRFSHQYIAMAA